MYGVMLLAGLPSVAAAFDCPDPVGGGHRLGPRPQGAVLGVVPADGRAARWDALERIGNSYY